jgi:hypothetical protein
VDGHSKIQIAHRPPWTGDGHLLGAHGRAMSQSTQDVGLPAIGPITLTKISVLEETSTNVKD